MTEIKNKEKTTVKLSKETSAMLSKIAEKVSMDKCKILEDFIISLNHVFDYASEQSAFGIVISPLEGMITIQVVPKQQFVLVQKAVKEDMAKKRALKGD